VAFCCSASDVYDHFARVYCAATKHICPTTMQIARMATVGQPRFAMYPSHTVELVPPAGHQHFRCSGR